MIMIFVPLSDQSGLRAFFIDPDLTVIELDSNKFQKITNNRMFEFELESINEEFEIAVFFNSQEKVSSAKNMRLFKRYLQVLYGLMVYICLNNSIYTEQTIKFESLYVSNQNIPLINNLIKTVNFNGQRYVLAFSKKNSADFYIVANKI